MKSKILIALAVLASLMLSGCMITDRYIEPDILAAFEKERHPDGTQGSDDNDNGEYMEATVTLLSCQSSNGDVVMRADVKGGGKIKEAGFVWCVSSEDQEPAAPTEYYYHDKVTSTVKNGKFEGQTAQTAARQRMKVKAYVIDQYYNAVYSECMDVLLVDNDYREPEVVLTRCSAVNWSVSMTAELRKGEAKEVGFVWNKSRYEDMDDPTVRNCFGRSASSLDNGVFVGYTPQIYDRVYIRVRAYAIDRYGREFYSESSEVIL